LNFNCARLSSAIPHLDFARVVCLLVVGWHADVQVRENGKTPANYYGWSVLVTSQSPHGQSDRSNLLLLLLPGGNSHKPSF